MNWAHFVTERREGDVSTKDLDIRDLTDDSKFDKL